MKKIFRFTELDIKVQEEMIAEYIKTLTKSKKLFRAFARDYFVEQEDVYNEVGDPVYGL
jgi:hypothetical protein